MEFQNVTRRIDGPVGASIEYLKSCPSTNDYLLDRPDAPTGHLVVTDLQTAGRGRGTHRWVAEAGENLLFSFCLDLATADSLLHLLPLLTSLAVCEGADAAGIAGLQTKWPNDIVSDERKLCGILIETRVQGDRVRAVIGIGLNVNQTAFTPELQASATSLSLVSGRSLDRELLLGRLIDGLNRWLFASDRTQAVTRYSQRCATIGKQITFDTEGERHTGMAAGIDEGGRLLIDEAGARRVYAGSEVNHLRTPE